jgi:hypothetical protein
VPDALSGQALTSPGCYGQFEETESLQFTAQDVVSFIASCHQLIELHLDDILTHNPDVPGIDEPWLAPSCAFTIPHLKAIAAGCPKLETFVVVRDPFDEQGKSREDPETGRLIPPHPDKPPRLIDLLGESDDALVDAYTCLPRACKVMIADENDEVSYEGTMQPLGWANHEEWVIPNMTFIAEPDED